MHFSVWIVSSIVSFLIIAGGGQILRQKLFEGGYTIGNPELYAYVQETHRSKVGCGASCMRQTDCYGINLHGGGCYLLKDLKAGGSISLDEIPGEAMMTGNLPELWRLTNTTYGDHSRPAEKVYPSFLAGTPDVCVTACRSEAACHAVDANLEKNGTVTCSLYKESHNNWVRPKVNSTVYMKGPSTMRAPAFFYGFEDDSEPGVTYTNGYAYVPGLVGRALDSSDKLSNRFFTIDTSVTDKCPFYPGPDCKEISIGFWMRMPETEPVSTEKYMSSPYIDMEMAGGPMELIAFKACVNNGTHILQYHRRGPPTQDASLYADPDALVNLTSADKLIEIQWWFFYVFTVSVENGIKLYMNGIDMPVYPTVPYIDPTEPFEVINSEGPQDLYVLRSNKWWGFAPVDDTCDAPALLDELMFWDVELSAQEVWDLYSSYNTTGFTEYPLVKV